MINTTDENMKLSINSTVIENGKVNIQFSSDGKKLYKVRIYLEGADLPFVESVQYVLPPNIFEPNILDVERSFSNPTCELSVWTRFLFPITIAVNTTDGESYIFQHNVNYQEELKEYKQSQNQNQSQSQIDNLVLS